MMAGQKIPVASLIKLDRSDHLKLQLVSAQLPVQSWNTSHNAQKGVRTASFGAQQQGSKYMLVVPMANFCHDLPSPPKPQSEEAAEDRRFEGD